MNYAFWCFFVRKHVNAAQTGAHFAARTAAHLLLTVESLGQEYVMWYFRPEEVH